MGYENSGNGQRLRLIDIVNSQRSVTTAAGAGSVQWPTANYNEVWLVDRIVYIVGGATTPAAATPLKVYVLPGGSATLQDNFVRDLDFGVLANVADYSSPIYVQQGAALAVAVTAVDSAVSFLVTVQYRLCELVPIHPEPGEGEEFDAGALHWPGYGPRVRTVR